MAVEARHLHLFPPQLLGNTATVAAAAATTANITNNSLMLNPTAEVTNPNGLYNGVQIGYNHLPLSGTTTATADALIPLYSSVITESLPPKTALKSDNSGVTYNIPQLNSSRKRSRESSNNPLGVSVSYPQMVNNGKACSSKSTLSFSFLGEDLSGEIRRQQFDVDRLVAQHMEKVRMEIEERRKREARRIVQVIEESMTNRLRAKEEEIAKIGKLNWALEERIRALCVENQIWRDLAQSNEATANALRANLEQVLAQAQQAQAHQVQPKLNHNTVEDTDSNALVEVDPNLELDDAESCCGSNSNNNNNEDDDVVHAHDGGGAAAAAMSRKRWCRSCGKAESCVLVLPCRHLCLCGVCGTSVHTCPVCSSPKNASVHVNMSSSSS